MGAISHHKVVAALPNPLEKDSVYFVRAGTGFDIYVTNSAGTVAASALNADGLVKALSASLGSAAYADLTTSHQDATSGRVTRVGNGGLLGLCLAPPTAWNSAESLGGGCRLQSSSSVGPDSWPVTNSTVVVMRSGSDHLSMIAVSRAHSRAAIGRVTAGAAAVWAELKTTANTAVDGNGFIKAASPIARVSDSAIEGVGALEKLATGHYRITQTQGLRLGGGWYIETPHGRNGDKYFNVEWYQNTEPASVDGFLDEEVDGVVIDLYCFERVWNPATGRHENGGAVDIPTGRWIDLRFNELKPAEEDELDELVEPH